MLKPNVFISPENQTFSARRSIRINDNGAICFRFEKGEAYDVEIVDYH